LNVEISNFGSKLKKVFSTDYNSESLISLPIESLCREKKLAGKLSKELVAKQKEIVKMSLKVQTDEKFLDILAKGCLAR
jgi:hypothetical protein